MHQKTSRTDNFFLTFQIQDPPEPAFLTLTLTLTLTVPLRCVARQALGLCVGLTSQLRLPEQATTDPEQVARK